MKNVEACQKNCNRLVTWANRRLQSFTDVQVRPSPRTIAPIPQTRLVFWMIFSPSSRSSILRILPDTVIGNDSRTST